MVDDETGKDLWNSEHFSSDVLHKLAEAHIQEPLEKEVPSFPVWNKGDGIRENLRYYVWKTAGAPKPRLETKARAQWKHLD